MPDERDNLIAFPVPATRLLRILLDEARSGITAERVAHRLITHVERTALGHACPWCRLPTSRSDQAPRR